MRKKMHRIAMVLGVGALLLTGSLTAQADDDGGGVWMGINLGPLRAWLAPPPPPVVVVRPPVRVYRDYPRRQAYGYGHDSGRDWRQREWRDHHRDDRAWRPEDRGYNAYSYDGRGRGYDN